MNKTFLQIIFFGSIITIGVGVGIIIKRASSSASGTTSSGVDDTSKNNFNSLLVNLGNVKSNNGAVSIPFNNSANTANFFNNNRLAIYKGKDLLDKGTYTDGGKSIKMDSGKTANGSSVYGNLELLS